MAYTSNLDCLPSSVTQVNYGRLSLIQLKHTLKIVFLS